MSDWRAWGHPGPRPDTETDVVEEPEETEPAHDEADTEPAEEPEAEVPEAD
jgi:hypothetical protein